jgi:Glycosyl transferase family 2
MQVGESDCVVVVPALNEETCIRSCIESLLRQKTSAFSVVVADGGSTDRTRAIVADIGKREPRVQMVENPGRLQSRAVNLVARRLGGGVKWLVRADAHTTYPPDFVEQVVAAARRTRASTVVVPMRAVGRGCFQRAAATAQNSRLGNGGALHRLGQSSQFVDHGHHALFELGQFRHVDGYDEAFSHNEDFELDYRISEGRREHLADLRSCGRLHSARLAHGSRATVFPARSRAGAHDYETPSDPEAQTGFAYGGAQCLRGGYRAISVGARRAVAASRALGNVHHVGRDSRMARARSMRGRQWDMCRHHASFLGNRSVRRLAGICDHVQFWHRDLCALWDTTTLKETSC